MKTAQKLLLSLILVATFLVVLPQTASASILHLTPGGGNVAVGQTLAVQVKLNTQGQPVNGVTALLSYPTDKLDVAYITAGSAFTIEAEKVVGGGNIRISRGNITGVSGDVIVATVGFRGKALGGANVAFINGSAAPSASNSSETLNLGGSAGGSFNVVAASSTPNSSPAAAVGPKISDIRVVEISTSSATISWKTDKNADSEIKYGVDRNNFILSTSKPERVTDHSLKLEGLDFAPGTKLYFQVLSKDANGRETASEINSLQLKGYRVMVKIIDKNSTPLPNIKVTIYSEPNESTTNDQGQVLYEDVTPGKHALLIQNGSLEKSEDIEVADNGSLDQVQEYTVQFDPANTTTPRSNFPLNSKNTLAMVILGLSLLTLVGIVIYVLRKRQGGGGTSSGGDSNPFPFFDNTNQPTNQNPVVFRPGQP